MHAHDIAQRLSLRPMAGSRGWAGDCPACGYANGLRLSVKDGNTLWWCASCGSSPELSAAVLGRTAPVAPATPRAPVDHAKRIATALRLWEEAWSAERSPVEVYLSGRGLVLPDGGALKYHAGCPHPSNTRCHAMIAQVVDVTGKPVAVHRTYLAPGGAGKATLDPPRATLGPVAGCMVRLCRWEPGQALVVGEGLETSLSGGRLWGLPAWAAVWAGNLSRPELPPDIRDVVIAADPDAPGQRGARAGAEYLRRQGRRVRIRTPHEAGCDFNDLLQRLTAREAGHA